MCISRARSTWGTQWPKDIQLSENLKFEASTTQRLGTRGNSKLLGRIMVIVFNVPSSYIYHFPKFLKIRGATPFAGYHSIHQIWACANLFGTLIYSTYKISSIFLMAILEAKNFKIQKLFYIFWKVWTTNTPSLNSWVVEAYIRIRLENGYTPEEKHG